MTDDWEAAYWDLVDGYWNLFLAHSRVWTMLAERVFQAGC